jgi:hypothetical protein
MAGGGAVGRGPDLRLAEEALPEDLRRRRGSFGPATVPDEVGASLFALGSERSRGTAELVASLERTEPGVIVRPADAEVIPPLSDYQPFWGRRIPFLFLSAGRSRVYHARGHARQARLRQDRRHRALAHPLRARVAPPRAERVRRRRPRLRRWNDTRCGSPSR